VHPIYECVEWVEADIGWVLRARGISMECGKKEREREREKGKGGR
jgi:hypothetical protein